MVRRYSLQAAHGGALAVLPTGADGKPPGSSLCGSAIEATILLQPGPHDAAAAGDWGGGGQQQLLAAVPPACLPASAEQVAGSLQQLLGMLRVLAPPVQLLMRLKGVLLQVGAEARLGGGVMHRACQAGAAGMRCPLHFLPPRRPLPRAGTRRQPAAGQRQPPHGPAPRSLTHWAGAAAAG